MQGSGAPEKKEEGAVQFEMYSREFMQVSQQDNWDGFRIEAGNNVTKHMQASHTLFLGTQLRECGYIYQFGPAFQSEDGRTVLVSRIGLDGGVNGRVIKKLGESWEFKGNMNSHLKAPDRNMHEASMEYNGAGVALGVKLARQGPWILGGYFSRKVLPELQLGGNLTLAMVNGITSIGEVGMRWSSGKDVFTAAVSRTPGRPGTNSHEGKLQFFRKVTDRLSLGTELKYNVDEKESALSLAYEYSFRQARVQGLLDTAGRVSCHAQDFTGFGFSGMIDYVGGDYKFGVVMHVLPQQEGQPQ